jgi:hypothetical protein
MLYLKLPLICVAAALAGLAGCAKIRYPDYYLRNASAPRSAARTTPLLGPVAVLQFGTSVFLSEGPIVYRESPEHLGLDNYGGWALDPRRAVTTTLVDAIRSRGVFQSVDLYDGSVTCDGIVSGTLDHLGEVDEGTGVLGRSRSLGAIEECTDWRDSLAGRIHEESEAGRALSSRTGGGNVSQNGNRRGSTGYFHVKPRIAGAASRKPAFANREIRYA